MDECKPLVGGTPEFDIKLAHYDPWAGTYTPPLFGSTKSFP